MRLRSAQRSINCFPWFVYILCSFRGSEQRQLSAYIPSLPLMFRNKYPFHYLIVCRGAERTTVRKLLYTVETVRRRLVGRNKDWFCLSLCPCVESFVVEALTFLIDISAFIGNVAVYHAISRYLYLLIVKHTACDRRFRPPPKFLTATADALGIAICDTLFRHSLCWSSLGRLYFF